MAVSCTVAVTVNPVNDAATIDGNNKGILEEDTELMESASRSSVNGFATSNTSSSVNIAISTLEDTAYTFTAVDFGLSSPTIMAVEILASHNIPEPGR